MDSEIGKFSEFYEIQINGFKKEIILLNNEIKKLKLQNESLQLKTVLPNTIDNYKAKYENLLGYLSQINGGVSYDLIDEWCLSSSFEDSFLLLSNCHKLITNNEYTMATYILELLHHNHNPLMHEDDKILEIFQGILSQIFVNKIEEIEEFDYLIESGLELILKLEDTELKNSNTYFIQKHFYKTLENILYLNNPSIIIKFMRVCMKYNLRLEIKDILYQIVNIEWGFLDSSITKDEFIFLLWYAYLFDFDEQLLEQASISKQWFQESYNDLSLYFYLYDSINKTINPNKGDYQLIKKKFQDGYVLTNFEKSEIFSRVESELHPLMVQQKMSKIIKEVKVDDTNKSIHFNFPKTEVEAKNNSIEIEEKALNENSALKLMGYQITGLTRDRRWGILEKAVPKLGLKKVTMIIAYNVKLRKGQKNGLSKYHHAITEWEYDLTKLKNKYYKKEFTWPNT